MANLKAIIVLVLVVSSLAVLGSFPNSTAEQQSASSEISFPNPYSYNFPETIQLTLAVSGNAVVDNTPLVLNVTADVPIDFVKSAQSLGFVAYISNIYSSHFLSAAGINLLDTNNTAIIGNSLDVVFDRSIMVNFTSVESQVTGYLQIFDQPPRSFNLSSYSGAFPFSPKYDFSADLAIGSSVLNSQEQQAITLAETANSISKLGINLDFVLIAIEVAFIFLVLLFEIRGMKSEKQKENAQRENDYGKEIEEIRKRKPSGIS